MNYLRHKISFWRLSRKKYKEREKLNEILKNIENKGSWEERQKVYATESVDLEMVDEEIRSLVTDYLVSKAQKMFLPVPSLREEDGFWEQGRYYASWYLTNKGVAMVRKSIRAEKDEKFNLAIRLAPAIIGIIGALTGMFAVISR